MSRTALLATIACVKYYGSFVFITDEEMEGFMTWFYDAPARMIFMMA